MLAPQRSPAPTPDLRPQVEAVAPRELGSTRLGRLGSLRSSAAWSIAGAFLLATLGVAGFVSMGARELARAHLWRVQERASSTLQLQLQEHEHALDAVAALYQASESVEPEEFAVFARSLLAGPSYPGISALAFVPAGATRAVPEYAFARTPEGTRALEALWASEWRDELLARAARSPHGVASPLLDGAPQGASCIALLADLRALGASMAAGSDKLLPEGVLVACVSTRTLLAGARRALPPETALLVRNPERVLAPSEQEWLARAEVEYGGARWQLDVVAPPPPEATVRLALAHALRLCGCVLAFLAFVVVARQAATSERLAAVARQLELARNVAEEARRTQSHFLANMSHEIRTPLNGLLGSTRCLLDGELENDARQQALAAHDCAQALLRVLDDILDFAKIEAGELDFREGEFDPRLELRRVAELLSRRAFGKGLELTLDVEPGVPARVRGDADRLGQVLFHLVDNGLKYTERGGVALHLSACSPDTDSVELVLEVRDSGRGIAGEALERIFDPFARTDESASRRVGGVGLGLTLCRRLVERMGGSLSCASELARGSVFRVRVRLPVVAWEAPRAERPSLAGPVLVLGPSEAFVQDLGAKLARHELAWERVVADETLLARLAPVAPLANERPGALVVDARASDAFASARPWIEAAERGGVRVLAVLREGWHSREDAERAHALLAAPLSEEALLLALARSRAASAAARAPAPAAPPRKLEILLVEDNPLNQRVATRVLRQRGHAVEVAADGREAVDAVRAHRFDVVVMDCQMPEMDGYEATRRIRDLSNTSYLPIIAFTAHALKGDRERCIEAGMDDYLAKPVPPETLVQTVERWAESRRRDVVGA